MIWSFYRRLLLLMAWFFELWSWLKIFKVCIIYIIELINIQFLHDPVEKGENREAETQWHTRRFYPRPNTEN